MSTIEFGSLIEGVEVEKIERIAGPISSGSGEFSVAQVGATLRIGLELDMPIKESTLRRYAELKQREIDSELRRIFRKVRRTGSPVVTDELVDEALKPEEPETPPPSKLERLLDRMGPVLIGAALTALLGFFLVPSTFNIVSSSIVLGLAVIGAVLTTRGCSQES